MSPPALASVEGHAHYGINLTKGLHCEQWSSPSELREIHDLVLGNFRLLVADLCQQFNGGHAG